MIIISRINEDISWLDIFTNKIIYNLQKMEGDTTNIITLNSNIIIHNHSHLYSLFHYIYNNYENLDEYTIFLELKDKGYPIENISFKEYLIESCLSNIYGTKTLKETNALIEYKVGNDEMSEDGKSYILVIDKKNATITKRNN
jgi:hypothetical protein